MWVVYRAYCSPDNILIVMKISKSLLHAIFAGVTVAATATACEHQKKETAQIHFPSCPSDCDIDHAIDLRNDGNGEGEEAPVPGNCPACGMC